MTGPALGAARSHCHLMQEELLEREAPPSLLGAVEALRKLSLGQGVGGEGEAAAGAKLRGQRLDRVARERPRLPGPLAKALRAPARRPDGRERSRSCGPGCPARPRPRRAPRGPPRESRSGRACRTGAAASPP